MSGDALWQRKSDAEILAAVFRLHEYDETGQEILLREMRRRGLEVPPEVASACRNCGAAVGDGATLCERCTAARQVRVEHTETVPAPVTFFEVGTQKFLVMSVCTFGFYALYWFYENWKAVGDARRRLGLSGRLGTINPMLRAVFAPLWAQALFREVRDAARAAGLEVAWRPWALASGYVVANVFYRLVAPFYPLPDQAAILSMTSLLFLVPVQRSMQAVNRAHGAEPGRNTGYTNANLACIAVGGAVLILVLVGLFFAPAKTPAPVEGAGVRASVGHQTGHAGRPPTKTAATHPRSSSIL